MNRRQELTEMLYRVTETTFPNNKQIATAIGKSKEWVEANVTRTLLPLSEGSICYPIHAVAIHIEALERKGIL